VYDVIIKCSYETRIHLLWLPKIEYCMKIKTILCPVSDKTLNQTEKTLYDDNIYLPTVIDYANNNGHIILSKRIKIQEKIPIFSAVYFKASLNSYIYNDLDKLQNFLKIKNLNNIYDKSVENSLNMHDNIYIDDTKYDYSTAKSLKSNQDIFRHMIIHKKIQNEIVSYLNKNILNVSYVYTIMLNTY